MLAKGSGQVMRWAETCQKIVKNFYKNSLHLALSIELLNDLLRRPGAKFKMKVYCKVKVYCDGEGVLRK